jgi:Protein of unknown function (DUF4239)
MSSIWVVLAPLCVLAVSIVAILGLFLVRRIPAFARQFNENEVAGLLYQAMGVVYGALLAFIVFATWESFANAQLAVTQEAADLVAAYRDTQTFPEPQRTQAQSTFRFYVNAVMATEWASHGTLTEHTTPDLLNPVWNIYRSVQPTTSLEESRLASATDHLYAVELQRHLRHLSSEATLPVIFWPLLLLGGIILIVFSYLFHQSSLRSHAVMIGVSTAMLIGVLILIYSLNEPFTGPVTVSQQPLLHALQQFHAIDLEQ